jgi:hypothetical protein
VTSSREEVGRKVGKPKLSTQVFDIIGCVAETEAVAAIAAATITLRHYTCDRCGQFHLTSRTKGKRIARPVTI